MNKYELIVLWADHTWTDAHFVMADTEEEAREKMLEELRQQPKVANDVFVSGCWLPGDFED